MKKIIFTGGSGKFGKVFKKFQFNKTNIYYPSSTIFDVTNLKKMEKFIKKIKPKFIIHAAAISRPMDLHEKKIEKSIKYKYYWNIKYSKSLSIKYKIKTYLFFNKLCISIKKGNYKEHHPLLPFNNYAWSKLRRRMCCSNVKKFTYFKNMYD